MKRCHFRFAAVAGAALLAPSVAPATAPVAFRDTEVQPALGQFVIGVARWVLNVIGQWLGGVVLDVAVRKQAEAYIRTLVGRQRQIDAALNAEPVRSRNRDRLERQRRVVLIPLPVLELVASAPDRPDAVAREQARAEMDRTVSALRAEIVALQDELERERDSRRAAEDSVRVLLAYADSVRNASRSVTAYVAPRPPLPVPTVRVPRMVARAWFASAGVAWSRERATGRVGDRELRSDWSGLVYLGRLGGRLGTRAEWAADGSFALAESHESVDDVGNPQSLAVPELARRGTAALTIQVYPLPTRAISLYLGPGWSWESLRPGVVDPLTAPSASPGRRVVGNGPAGVAGAGITLPFGGSASLTATARYTRTWYDTRDRESRDPVVRDLRRSGAQFGGLLSIH